MLPALNQMVLVAKLHTWPVDNQWSSKCTVGCIAATLIPFLCCALQFCVARSTPGQTPNPASWCTWPGISCVLGSTTNPALSYIQQGGNGPHKTPCESGIYIYSVRGGLQCGSPICVW
jgi:hypothetical protein